MPKYTSRLFQGTAKKPVSKSMKDLSHDWVHDIQVGDYVPFLWIPTLPGDEFEIECEFFFKFEPLYYPVIHRCSLDADLFWIPNRIMWPAVTGDPDTGWTNWIMLKNETEHPTIDVDMEWFPEGGGGINNSIMGYLGIPYLLSDELTRHTTITGLNAFPAMAYLMCWDQYYRNPQLEDERAFPLVAGDNTAAMIAAYGFTTPTNVRLDCLPAKWMKDYFTSALPTPQLGDAIQIPLTRDWNTGDVLNQQLRDSSTGAIIPSGILLGSDAQGDLVDDTGTNEVYIDMNETAPDMRELRIAEKLQQFREWMIKIGQRYRDYVIGFFSEDPTPMDISVPLLIGNYKGIVQVSEVMSQALTLNGDFPQNVGDYVGNMSLYESARNKINFKCREHGLILGIMNIMPNTSYGQGINRYWRYSTPYDYPMDMFSTVGDQEIKNEELFYLNLNAEQTKNQNTFGYIPKYSEASYISNNFGTNLSPTGTSEGALGLSMHLGRWWNPGTTVGAVYDNTVELDNFFISASGSEDAGNIRISDVWKTLTTPNGDATMKVVTAFVAHTIKAMRPLPAYSTPGLT